MAEERLCDGCGCVADGVLMECPNCDDVVGDCCWDAFEGLCTYCIDERDEE